MGGARVWRMVVKVGRARERSSPPDDIFVSSVLDYVADDDEGLT